MMRSDQRVIKFTENLQEGFRSGSWVEEDIELRVREAITYKVMVGGMRDGSFCQIPVITKFL